MKKLYYTLQYYIRWYSPIYINTLNIFRPFKTLWKGRKIISKENRPHFKLTYGCITNDNSPIYSEYYWDGYFAKNNKLFHCLITDIMWKTKFNIVEYEEPPRYHFVIFGKYYLTISIEFKDNYKEYERILKFIYSYYK